MSMAQHENSIASSLACNCSGTTQATSSSENSLSNNGGLIAMAAGLSIIVPFVCVLLLQVRRAAVAERARREAEAHARENGLLRDPIRDPPPAYEQVFGLNFNHSSSVPFRNGSRDVLVQENDYEQTGSRNTEAETENRFPNVWRGLRPPGVSNVIDNAVFRENNQLFMQEQISNQASSPVSVATISGYHVTDINGGCNIVPPYLTNEVVCPITSELIVPDGSLSDNDPERNVSHVTSSCNQSSSVLPPLSLSSTPTTLQYSPLQEFPPQEAHMQECSMEVLPPQESPPRYSVQELNLQDFPHREITPQDSHMQESPLQEQRSPDSPPQVFMQDSPMQEPYLQQSPAYTITPTWPNQGWNNTRHNIPESLHIQEAVTQHPCMHISVEEFLSSVGGLQDNESDAPPPSYEEALKILESVSLAKDLENVMK